MYTKYKHFLKSFAEVKLSDIGIESFIEKVP